MSSMDSTSATAFSNAAPAVDFTPKLAPNIIFLMIFIALLLAHFALFLRHLKYYGYAIGMLGGSLLEMVGYIAKVQLSHNRANKSAYIGYIIGLTLGPTFLAASLYLSIAALQRSLSARCFVYVSPTVFAAIFMVGDFLCLCFIGVGGSLAAIFAPQPIGVDLMIAGLACQVLFTSIFCFLLIRLYAKMRYIIMQDRRRYYVLGAFIASLCLFIRSCWRVAELSGGFNGPLTSREGLFIALDSIPISVMCIALTVMHPGMQLFLGSKGVLQSTSQYEQFTHQVVYKR